MRINHEFVVRSGTEFVELKRVINSIDETEGVEFSIDDEWVGYGMAEHTEPTLTIRWSTDE